MQEVPDVKLELKEVHRLSRMIYDQMIQSTVKLIHKLSAFQNQDPLFFDNLVQFSANIYPRIHTDWFLPWIYSVGKDLIVFSEEHPQRSGFYRMMTFIMRICEHHGYFNEISHELQSFSSQTPVQQQQQSQAPPKPQRQHSASLKDSQNWEMDESNSYNTVENANNNNNNNNVTQNSSPVVVSVVVDRDKELAFTLFSKFLKEVLTLIKQYKDDLLAACLEFVLSMPRRFIDVSSMAPALSLALKLGTR